MKDIIAWVLKLRIQVEENGNLVLNLKLSSQISEEF